jgi:hypothetical protein
MKKDDHNANSEAREATRVSRSAVAGEKELIYR